MKILFYDAKIYDKKSFDGVLPRFPQIQIEPRAAFRDRQYDLLAYAVRESLDLNRIYEAMEEYSR